VIVAPAVAEIEYFRGLVGPEHLGLHFEDSKLISVQTFCVKRMEDTDLPPLFQSIANVFPLSLRNAMKLALSPSN